MISRSWSFCLSYEFELRKEAFRLCKEQQYGIQAALYFTRYRASYEALASTHCDPEHTLFVWRLRVSVIEENVLPIWRRPAPDLLAERHRNRPLLVLVRLCLLSLLLLLLLLLALKGRKGPHADITRTARGKERAPLLQLVRKTSSIS